MVSDKVEYIGNANLKISIHFHDIMDSWHNKKIDGNKVWLINNDMVNIGLAIHFFNKKLKTLNTFPKIDTFNDRVKKLLKYWAGQGYIHPESRGISL